MPFSRTMRVVPDGVREWERFFKDLQNDPASIPLASIEQIASNSLIGNVTAAAASPAVIQATVNNHVMRLSAGTLGFGFITSASVSDFNEAAQDAVGNILIDSSSIDFTYTDATGEITAVVLPAGVNHNALLNYVADQHVAHTGVTLTAGTGLTGGGDISASRSFAVNLGATFAWTNQHTFSLAGNMATPTVLMSSTQPTIAWEETDQAADEKRWGILPSAKVLQFRSSTDTGGSSIIWGAITRGTGTAITNIALGDTTNNNTYTFGSTGTATFSGQVTGSKFVPTSGAAGTNSFYLPASNTPAISSNSTLAMQWDGSQNCLGKAAIRSDSATAGVGYATGAGGTVTQASSRTTGVTLNKVCGAITLVSAAGSASWQSFTVTNSAVAATDCILVNQKSGTDLNMIHVTAVAAGSFQITFATTGGTTVEQPVFNFAVVKAVAA